MNQNFKWKIIQALAWVPDPIYISIQHRLHHGFFPNLKHPQSFSAYFMKLKLDKKIKTYTQYTHKDQCKEWIKTQVGSEWVIPTIYEAQTLTYEKLCSFPMPYIIKPTLGSQQNFVIKDLTDLKKIELTRRPHHLLYRERNYEGKKGWMIEPLFDDITAIHDYKAMCFHGKVFMFQVSLNNESKSRCMVDLEGKIMPYPFTSGKEEHFDIRYKDKLKQLTKIAETCAKPFEFVRVDFMISDKGCIISELTFFPQGGYLLRKDRLMNYEWLRYFHKEVNND